MKRSIQFTLNGESVTLDTDDERKLLWVLRTDMELTGSKYGCGSGFCGSCTVLVDGEPVRSCVTRLNEVHGREVMTVEGLATNERLNPLQQAFVDVGGFQCGYCTPGMLMSAYGLLSANSTPTREEIIQWMEGNLCRCSAYTRIIEAIEVASGQMGGSHE